MMMAVTLSRHVPDTVYLLSEASACLLYMYNK